MTDNKVNNVASKVLKTKQKEFTFVLAYACRFIINGAYTVWPASVDFFVLCLLYRYQALQNMHYILELNKAKLSNANFWY